MSNESGQLILLTSSTSASPKMLGIPGATSQVNLENVEDFSNVCRTCATITEFVVPIFSGEGLQNCLAEKINKHLPIQVSEQDVLPQVVCYQCASTLLAWHELVACCEQANTALRSRLARAQRAPNSTQESKSVEPQPTSSTGDDSQSKSGGTEGAPAPPPPAAVPAKVCEFCNERLDDTDYTDHVIAAHSAVLFHCKACNKFIDQKDCVLHMTLHAARLSDSNRDIKPEKIVKRETTDGTGPGESGGRARPPKTEDRQKNEFSDHSDTEFGFGPLPTSVFEAIEDTRDSQQPADEEPVTIEIEDNSDSESHTEVENQTVKSHKRARTCPFCAKVYTASSSYFYHLKHFHNKSKDYECEVCGRKFGAKASLQQHARLHSADRDYKCKECNKQFKSKASLYIHEQTHTGTKAWSCKQCGKSFRWRTHLQRHVSRHAAEKSHVCAVCRRGFTIRCDLLRHARTHAAGSYTCDTCGNKFAQLRYLKVHIEKKHMDGGKESHCV